MAESDSTASDKQQAKPIIGQEITRRQGRRMLLTAFASGAAKLPRIAHASYDGYRKMCLHPTIAIARELSSAPLLVAEWQTEADDGVPDDRVKFIRDQVFPHRDLLMQTITDNESSYGWSPWEKVFRYVKAGGRTLIGIERFKPLLVDITSILLRPERGEFAGFAQRYCDSGGETEIPLQQALLVSFRVEGDNLYGIPALERARETYNDWVDCNDAACRFDSKMAGALWVLRAPEGTYVDDDGVTHSNMELARQIQNDIEASGSIILPSTPTATSRDVERGAVERAWDIKLMEAQPKQYSFNERLQYLDKLLVRASLSPERVMTEGKFGDRASAEAQGELALTARERLHRFIVSEINRQVVDQLLELNWGEQARGTVRIKASPLSDARLAFFTTIFTAMLADPVIATEIVKRIDVDAFMDALAVPKTEAVVEAIGEGQTASSTAMSSRIVGDRLRELYAASRGNGDGRRLAIG